MARHLFLSCCFLALAVTAKAQISYISPSHPVYHLLDRLETKSGTFSNRLFLSNKGISRQDVYDFLTHYRSSGFFTEKSAVDNYHIFKNLSINGEWADSGIGTATSKYSLGPFYKKKPDMVYVKTPNFFWVLNPILGGRLSYALKPDKKVHWTATEGLRTRGRIADWVGFSMALTNNNLNPLHYEQHHIEKWEAVPGADAFQKNGNQYHYWQFEGNLDVRVIKDHINLDIGYGKHFIGDGIRSLFLSDYGGNALYVGLNTKIWRINYQNLYLKFTPQDFSGMPKHIGHTYAAIHYLNINLTRWLNVGAFESILFSRYKGYEIGYLNPIIFYRTIERALGSPDKVALGLNAKAIVAKRLNFYGQFLLNEFKASEFFSDDGYWANKWGLQLGGKYFDAFGVSNLYLQGEINMARPYTYSNRNRDSALVLGSYSTWNQPLAHPLGSGFQEILGVISYQPAPRWKITARAMLYRAGIDTGQANLGNNIFKDYRRHEKDYGVHFINGPEAKGIMANLNVQFEWKPNLYFIIGATYRKRTVENNILPEQNDVFFTGGFRLNMFRSAFQNWY